jgi:hypothetical protein
VRVSLGSTHSISTDESWFYASVDQVSIDETLLWRRVPKDMRDFLSLAVTSHFECCGYSVVIGESKEEVERFLRTMAMFGPPEHLRIASMVANRYDPENECVFVPGLHYQGFFLEDPHAHTDADTIYPLSEDIIVEAHLPVSVTNLITKKVFRARHVHEYRVLRADRFAALYRSLGNPVLDSEDENEPTFGEYVCVGKNVFKSSVSFFPLLPLPPIHPFCRWVNS